MSGGELVTVTGTISLNNARGKKGAVPGTPGIDPVQVGPAGAGQAIQLLNIQPASGTAVNVRKAGP
jgi:hypothetical protein